MLSLVRLALTAAVMVAIALRLRRRPPAAVVIPAPAPEPRRRVWIVVLLACVVVALMIAAGVYAMARAADGGTGGSRAEAPPAVSRTETPLGTGTPPGTGSPSGPQTSAFPTTNPPTSATGTPTPGAVSDPCAPTRRPLAIRPLDPSVRRAVNRQWHRIERWLQTNAPKSYAVLTSPGRARTIAIAESQTGLDFPDDLRASLLRHNGGFPLPGGGTRSIREIRDEWRATCTSNAATLPFAPGQPPLSEAGAYYAFLSTTADALEGRHPLNGYLPKASRGRLTWHPTTTP
ncbi:SMI1/KNR4 family protein [Nonomuraea sp. NPDC050556]|uniref:SMI1/KNR4 family protein n=1 Tax=Nonomuraea sp. NPDC050556 TaxID=3364369 RepID=UPI00378E5B9E